MPKHSFFREVLPNDGDGDLLGDGGAGADGDGDLLGDIFPFAEVQ